ncbi:uncharacterized protein LOC129705152 [Leucoraja erinacea]|uniref:uncharacterized protein LOC129705152 n=1 Tax=Leucoraja erinaceus TaxID=7782 RepID=UPI0024547809|nr:uncharacterized protein LOC129705152 [Leucoraja erinacea]
MAGLPMLLLHLTMLSAVSSDSVKQLPQILTVDAGEKAVFYCTFPFVRVNSGLQVRWWKGGERSYLEASSGQRHSFEIRNKVSAAFRLHDVRVTDSGRYYCSVQYKNKVQNGTGTELLVTVSDNPPQITSTLVRKGSSVFLRLLCTAAKSRSRELDIKWIVNGSEVDNSAELHVQPWPGDLFQVSSSLEEEHPARNGTVYTCRVSYPDKRVQNQVYVYKSDAEEAESAVVSWWIYICLGSGALLLTLLVTAICCVCKRKRRNDEYRNVREERTPPNHRMAPMTVDSRYLKKGIKPNQMNRKTRCPHVPPRGQREFSKVIYATPQHRK